MTVREDTISLRFELKEGKSADLEVILSATSHWVNAVKAAAKAIDPDVQVRIMLIDADRGSLRLNAILEFLENNLEHIDQGTSTYPRLRKAAVALAIFLVVDAPSTLDYYVNGVPEMNLSEEDRERIDTLIEQTKSIPKVSDSSTKFFNELSQSPEISAIDISEGPEQAPIVTVPSREFAERGGLWAREEEERTRHEVLKVILIRPFLHKEPRTWGFGTQDGSRVNAVMRDIRFLAALERKHVQEQLRTGIEMEIELEIKEMLKSGEWIAKRKGRSVVKVISPEYE